MGRTVLMDKPKATLADIAIGGKLAPRLTTEIGTLFARDNKPRSIFEIARELKTKDLDAINNVISRLEHEFEILEQVPSEDSHIRRLKNGIVRMSPRYRVSEEHINDVRIFAARRDENYFETTY